MRVMARRRPRTVAAQMLVWQLAMLVLLVTIGLVIAYADARHDAYGDARARALDIARSVADGPQVATVISTPQATDVLQPYAERVRRDTGTDFVVIMSPKGIRFTHPDPTQIGGTFRGTIAGATEGREVTETYTGTLGPSVRAVVPITNDGRVVGLVSVGIRMETVQRTTLDALPGLLLVALGVGAIGALGAWLVQRRLRRQTHGLGEVEITRMYEYYDAVLRAVREGLLLLDGDGRVMLANEEARRLLDAPDSLEGQRLADVGLTTDDAEPAEVHDRPVVLRDRVVVMNQAPAQWNGRFVGWVVTLRDRTELQAVTAELDTVRGMATALRAQNHEAANRLHTMVSLVEMGETDAAIDFATAELEMTRSLADTVVAAVDEPVLEALLLGKTSQAQERGVRLTVDEATSVERSRLTAHELVTVVGNLLDNAIDAAQAAGPDGQVHVLLHGDEAGLDVVVDDSGAGIPEDLRSRVLASGWSDKPDPSGQGRGVGLALVGQVARLHGGEVTIGASDLGGASVTVSLSTAAGSAS
ncbi:hypothetical protein VV01_19985 [Luteipulveratus halotolerans]|uniref:histidine kinase n=2 Tax=Luteipulveratus halotolerans TaxID=1631356 RepID=A0A0L6CMK6_9MICO|nr:hypothetical protein VV01_19985 [Luteipulveratus halotolerans]